LRGGIGMIISILANILIALGSAALAYLVVKGIAITMAWLKNKIRQRMENTHKDQVIVSQHKIKEKMAEAINQEIKEHGTSTMSMEELDAVFDHDGLTMAAINSEDEIEADTIEMFTTDDMDDKTRQLLKAKGDMLKVTQ